ncbi:MAG: hypothetical protein RLZZ40_748, partial [Actinomycetota bacterium]
IPVVVKAATGRNNHGASRRIRMVKSGQPADKANDEIANIRCGMEYPTSGVGNMVRPYVHSPATTNTIRPGIAKVRPKIPAMIVSVPPRMKKLDMTPLTGDSVAARSLMVWRIGSYSGHNVPAINQPDTDWIGPMMAAMKATRDIGFMT